MRRCAFALAWLPPVLMLGCERVEYDVFVDPTGDQIDRRITINRKGAVVLRDDDDEVVAATWGGRLDPNRIAGLYGAPCPTLRPKPGAGRPAELAPITFRNTFDGRTPDDVGGAGFYTRLKTKMGSACLYVERFRGNDDQAGKLEEHFRDIDQAVGCFRGWLKVQLEGDADLPKLDRFLQEDLRRDLKNLALAMWTRRNTPGLFGEESASARQTVKQVMAARILAYLVERGYLRPSDLPALYRGVAEGGQLAPNVQRVVTRFLSERLGIASKRIHGLFAAAVQNPGAALRSWEAWKTKDPKLRPWVRGWQELRHTPERPDALDVSNGDVAAGIVIYFRALFLGDESLFELFCPADTLTFRLRTSTRPLYTSGRWDPDARGVRWEGPLPSETLPRMCYALWCWPDEKFQEKRFGRVVLAGNDLVEYCLWRKSLTPAEAREWERFLAGCKPGRDLPRRLRRFAGAPASEQPPSAHAPPYARLAADLLLRALDPKPGASQ